MATKPGSAQARPTPYGSARDLPSYQEMSQQVQGFKLLTLFVARDQRDKILEVERELERLIKVVDGFYDRLGSRNWIYHDLLNVSKVEAILVETSEPEAAEARLIELYQDDQAVRFWIMRLRAHEEFRARSRQMERAWEHFHAGQFDSCVLHLIAVVDGFVNDFEPDARKGLASREPDEMAAWDSVVGHHMGLTHAMKTFGKTIKKRVDDEVFDVYRHGIVHGSVVNFNNVVVAAKAWNLLFAVADWATAARKAANPPKPTPTWSDTWSALKRHAAYQKHEREFTPSEITPMDPGFGDAEVALRAGEFLDSWQHRRWGLVAQFMPPLLELKSTGEAARFAKDVFDLYDIAGWEITAISHDRPSSAEVRVSVTVNGASDQMRFRMALWARDGSIGIPGDAEATWRLAVWAPRTFFSTAA